MTSRTLLAGVLVLALVLLISVGDIDARKSSRRGGSSGSSGWGLSKSRSTPRSKPQQQQQSHGSSGGSNPGTIGWNVPASNTKPVGSSAAGSSASSTYPKASAPSEHATRTSATNVQSGYPGSNVGAHGNPPPYSPSGGYNNHGAPPAYNPSSSGGYHGGPPAYSGGYHGGAPPAYSSGGYNGGANHGFNPSYGNYGSGHGFNSQPGQGYNPSYGHSSYGAQPQTVILQSQGSRPGIGQLAKEAFVFAGVSAGVNAAVNRILPGGIYGHSPGHSASSSGVVPPVSHTQITYNNYYNNGTGEAQPGAPAGAAAVAAPVPPAGPAAAAPAPAAPDTPPAPGPAAAAPAAEPAANNQQQQQNSASPTGFITSDAELQKLTEDLFTKDTNNAFKHITVKVQGQKMDESVTDDAAENLLEVKPEAWEIPTVKAVLALHDNYELDVKTKETVTSEERKEESDLLDAFIATDVMKTTMKFLAEKGFVPNDEYEFKDSLKRIWFSQFKRIDGDPSSSGFETVFLAEKFDNEIIGLHDWIYFAKQEEAKKLDYLGYIKKLDLGTNGVIVKGRSKLNDVVQPITTIFVGTSPELEMALYTLCFYTRPNTVCPIKMGGADFLIVANAVNYFGKDILISAFPDI